MKRRLVALALAAMPACGPVEVEPRRCTEVCAAKILNTYDEGAPIHPEALRAWVEFCERGSGRCCQNGPEFYRCEGAPQ